MTFLEVVVRLVNRQSSSSLLGSPHGGEKQNVEDNQGDARNYLDKDDSEPVKKNNEIFMNLMLLSLPPKRDEVDVNYFDHPVGKLH